MEATLTEIEGWSSSVESTVSKGGDPFVAMRSLKQMASDIDFAEQQLKQKSIVNINFRTSQEWFEAQTKLKKTRQNVLERVNAVENIALTGSISPDPLSLMVDMDELTTQQKRIKPNVEKYK